MPQYPYSGTPDLATYFHHGLGFPLVSASALTLNYVLQLEVSPGGTASTVKS